MIEHGNKTTCFYQCWTRKEALYKAFGSGLPDDLASVDSTKSMHKINDNFFQLKTFQLTEEYILSVATSGDQAREIIVHER
jgi:phosphopantetheinyl transferase